MHEGIRLGAANIAAWQQYASAAAATEQPAPDVLPRRLEWTQAPGLGPGEEILGPLPGKHILELGCGTGQSAAFLASRGAHVTAVDAAEAQLRRAHTRWAHFPHVEFVCAEAHEYLTRPGLSPDVVLSIFGALDFTSPETLLPLIATRLRPGGRLALSTVHPDRQPPQQLPVGTSASASLTRPLPAPSWWPHYLRALDFTRITSQSVITPGEHTPCCLILTATAQCPAP